MIQFRDIDLSFNNKVIFNNFNMDVARGQKVLLNAPSGRGKTTLFKLLLGFCIPDKGKILLNEKTLEKKNLPYFRTNIGYVSQDVDLRNLKIWDLIVEIFSYKYNKHIHITKDKFISIAQYFELPLNIDEKEVFQLSGGERQRLGLVICILLDRKIWLLDEITSGLDKNIKEKIVDFVLNQDKTILIISHDKIWRKNDVVRIEEW